jgi:hypothetical protein
MATPLPDLSLEALAPRLPERPRIDHIESYAFTDQVGDPAIQIIVVMEDPVTWDTRWDDLKPIKEAVVAAVRETGDERFPYVRFVNADEVRQLQAA